MAKVNLRDRIIKDLRNRYPDPTLSVSDLVMLALTQLDLYVELVHKGIAHAPEPHNKPLLEQKFDVDDSLLGSLADMVHINEESNA